jgi:hypothetical protein
MAIVYQGGVCRGCHRTRTIRIENCLKYLCDSCAIKDGCDHSAPVHANFCARCGTKLVSLSIMETLNILVRNFYPFCHSP